MNIPVISRFQANCRGEDVLRANRVARLIRMTQPQLEWRNDNFRNLVVQGAIEDRPTLHLDDFSEIPVIGQSDNSRVLQQRARLRAGHGDWVAQSRSIESGYSDYCEYDLGLGRVNWLAPAAAESDTRQLALNCWQDRRLRHDLIHAIRREGLRYFHPHISTMAVWELAAMLSAATRLQVNVIGPTPALARWANNKIEFTRAAAFLLGRHAVPHTESAFNFSMLTSSVQRLSETNERLCVKFPYGTGGYGNFVIDSSAIRGRNLNGVHEFLKELLSGFRWPQGGRVLIDVWENQVVSSPSVQFWIPPTDVGEPVIEGVFEQYVTPGKGQFLGSCPVELPKQLEQEIVNQGHLLALMFQQLGYVGRCSFDLILVGNDREDCCLEFIECNARWGGTSIPMTLMNRLDATTRDRTWGVRQLSVDGLDQVTFASLRRHLGPDLFDPLTKKGRFVLINPARISEQSALEAIAIGKTNTETDHLLSQVLPQILEHFVQIQKDSDSRPTKGLPGQTSYDTNSIPRRN